MAIGSKAKYAYKKRTKVANDATTVGSGNVKYQNKFAKNGGSTANKAISARLNNGTGAKLRSQEIFPQSKTTASSSNSKEMAYSAKIKKASPNWVSRDSFGSETRNKVKRNATNQYNTGNSIVKTTQAFKNAGKTGVTVGSKTKRDTLQGMSDWDMRFGNYGSASADYSRIKNSLGVKSKGNARAEKDKRRLALQANWRLPSEARRIKRKTGK